MDLNGSDVVNPATGEVVARVPAATVEETDAAIERTRGAFDGWRPVSPGDRARLLRRFAAVVAARSGNLSVNSNSPCATGRRSAQSTS